MTLTQLEYLVAIDTHRSFVAAAVACFVSQPALSMQIQKLEQELGVELFDRNAKPIRPTDIGEQVIRQARVVLREHQHISEIIQQSHASYDGELRLGIIPTVSPYLLPLILNTFAERYPRVRLRFTDLTTPHVLQALLTDQLDAGIIATQEDDRDLLSTELYQEAFVGYVSQSHRLTDRPYIQPSDLRLDDLWLLSEGHCFRQQTLEICAGENASSSMRRNVQFESGSLETLMKMVEHQGGMTLLPELALRYIPAERQQIYVRTFLNSPVRKVRLIRHRSYLKQHLIEALVAVIHERVKPGVNVSKMP